MPVDVQQSVSPTKSPSFVRELPDGRPEIKKQGGCKYFPVRTIAILNKSSIFAPVKSPKNQSMEDICTIKDIYKTLYQFEKAFAECNGMTINEAMILCCLKDGEAKTAGALSEFVGLSNSRISKVINAVEGKQLICRLINPNDKRQMLFSLTPEGRACIATMQGKDLGFDNFFTNLRKCLG